MIHHESLRLINTFLPSRHHSITPSYLHLRRGVTHLVSHFHVLLELPGKFYAKAMLEDLPDVLKGHSLDFWVTEVNSNPAEEADRGVEAKCA